jgi:hypothetical protein
MGLLHHKTHPNKHHRNRLTWHCSIEKTLRITYPEAQSGNECHFGLCVWTALCTRLFLLVDWPLFVKEKGLCRGRCEGVAVGAPRCSQHHAHLIDMRWTVCPFCWLTEGHHLFSTYPPPIQRVSDLSPVRAGRVYKARLGEYDVAVKVIEHNSRMASAVENEVQLMMNCKHPNVVAAYHYVTHKHQQVNVTQALFCCLCAAAAAAAAAAASHTSTSR